MTAIIKGGTFVLDSLAAAGNMTDLDVYGGIAYPDRFEAIDYFSCQGTGLADFTRTNHTRAINTTFVILPSGTVKKNASLSIPNIPKYTGRLSVRKL
jgi:hypothetical protein